MKICMVNAEWLPVPPVLGGAVETTLYETAMGIDDPSMSVVSPWHPKLDGAFALPPGKFHHVDIKAEEGRVREILGDRAPRGEGRNRTKAKIFHYLSGVGPLIEAIDPDVIQVHNRMEFIPYFVERFPERKVFLYMHNDPTTSGIEVGSSVSRIDKVIFVSRYLARGFAERFPECDFEGQVIYNGVDVKTWHPDKKHAPETDAIRERFGLTPGRTLVFVGRTVYEKGITYLLEAMKIVRERMADAKLMVVGSPFYGAVTRSPFHASLQKRAKELGDGVCFTGFVDRLDTPYYYAAADVTVVPSVWPEPFGKVLIESMACGVPVVASRRGGIPEVVRDGCEGLLIDRPQEIDTLAETILALLSDDARRARAGEAARKTAVGDFSTQVRFDRLRDFYNEIRMTDQAA